MTKQTDSILFKIKDDVIRHAEIMSRILKVAVEVVDDQLNRITGGNIFAEQTNKENFLIGNVYKEVLATGKKQVIDEPGVHRLCFDCVNRGRCREKFEMSTPVIFNDKVIGVIGFVCFTNEQKDYILANFEVFSDFLDQMAGLICLKAAQRKENERMVAVTNMMNDIIDKIGEGVLIFDRNKNLQRVNAVAKEMLGCRKGDIAGQKIFFEKMDEPGSGGDDYKINYLGKDLHVVGKLFNIYSDEYNEVFIFRDVNALKADAMAFVSAKERIGVNRLSGQSRPLLALKKTIKTIASSSSSVMIMGESGTGKELIARALHEEGSRADHPFVAINCGAIPENLLESELFGYVRGAFTGADPRGKVGKFELAHNGTLFLDEIGDMPLHIQVKLNRVLEEKKIVRLGSNKLTQIDVRVVAATNKDLEALIKEHKFREDLFYRLNVIPLKAAPLRVREGDIRLLSKFFIRYYSRIFNRKPIGIEDEFWQCLEQYHWPGNIRELQNTVEYVVNVMPGNKILTKEVLPEKIRTQNRGILDPDLDIGQMEKKMIMRAFELYGSDGASKKIVAEKLGVGIATLYRKMKKYHIGS